MADRSPFTRIHAYLARIDEPCVEAFPGAVDRNRNAYLRRAAVLDREHGARERFLIRAGVLRP